MFNRKSYPFKHLQNETDQQLAKDAGAVYHVKRVVLVNLDVIDEYLEEVKAGDKLVEFDINLIKKEGYSPDIMVVVLEDSNLPKVAYKTGEKTATEPLFKGFLAVLFLVAICAILFLF